MRRMSKKRQTESKEYTAQRRKFLDKLPICEVCGKANSTDVHHRKGRGKYYLDDDSWLSVCRRCHDRIHVSPDWGRANGYIVDR